MAFTTKVYNNSAISYFEAQKLKEKDNFCNLSSDVKRSPKKQNDERRSTKKWVLKAFYSDSGAANNNSSIRAGKDLKSSAPSTSAAPDRKESAPMTDHSQVQSTQTNKFTQETRAQPSIRFQESLISLCADKFKFCLIGEFTQTRPKLSAMRRWVREKWALKGNWSLTLLDPSHVLIRLENDDDMLLIWTKQKWVVQGHLMKVFRWSSNYLSSSGRETSLATVWVSFPRLPLVFFEEDLLRSIASLVGKVVVIDDQTRKFKRTDVARAWVEVDLGRELPKELWIGIGNSGFWQPISYSKLPSYCTNCRLQGHSTNRCKFNNIRSRDRGNRLLEDDDRSSGKWAQFRSLFQDGEEDTSFGTLSADLLTGMSATEGEESEKGQRKKIFSDESFYHRGANIFSEEEVAEDGAAATEKHQRANLGVEEEQRLSEAQNCKKVVFDEQREKGKQALVGKEGDHSAIENKIPTSSSDKKHKKAKQVFQPIMEINNDKSQLETAPSRSSSREQPVWFQERKESDKGESSELKEDVSDVNEIPMQANYVETSNASEPQAPIRYSASEVKKMTKSFSKEIGRGGFGTVYEGKLRDGRQVAVKLLHRKGAVKEFDREVRIIGGKHQENIVKLLGFCPKSSKRALIYEFMPNKSLDKFIEWPSSLDSQRLHQIAVGIARGLDYLHRGPSARSVVHLDIKPANILLDENFCPKISDFGLAKEWAIGEKQSYESIRGTHGYIAPENLDGFKPSSKSDVYSYGVMLLEMAVGRRARNRLDLFEWAKENINHQSLYRRITNDDTGRKMIVVGLWCVQADPEDRPSMRRVLKMLESKVEDLKMPSRLRRFPTDPSIPSGPVDSLDLYLDRKSWFFEKMDNSTTYG